MERSLEDDRDILVLGEIAAVLADGGRLLCNASVEIDGDGYVAVTVRIKPESQQTTHGALAVLELAAALRHVIDLGTLRALAERFNIPAAQLEALVPELRATGEQKVATRADVMDVYAEGVDVGMDLGKRMAGPEGADRG